ncbi:MAG: 4Fe-4S binding protein [Candidatus Omnitrophica bacterium]|nr:4Fe-4S binding protein [Candidatus Omnitrophota bacterium]
MRNISLFISLRRITQIFFLFLSIGFIRKILYFDPLLSLSLIFSTRNLAKSFFVSLFILIFTIVLGRFFCGWFCPLGTLNQAVSYISKKLFFKRRKELYHPAQKIKYFITIVLLLLAIFRINLAGLFSPVVIFYRGFYLIGRALFSLFIFLNKYLNIFSIDRIFYWLECNIADFSPQSTRLISVVSLGFIMILAFNLFTTRFWCRFLCPLGGFLGVISRKSILHILGKGNCTGCLRCIEFCQGTCNPHLKEKWVKQECLFCMHCLNCPEKNLQLGTRISKAHLQRLNYQKVDFSRREFLYTLGGSVLFYPLLKFGFKRSISLKVIRPPGAIEENDFLNQCIRCQACIKHCPTQFLQPLLFARGISSLFTPYGNGRIGYCKYTCHLCGIVCPTGALKNLTLSQKQKFKIGTAFIDKKRCLVYEKGINCLACYRHCPLQDKAIISVNIGRGLSGPEIVPESCIGCALCENICPAEAIKTKAI